MICKKIFSIGRIIVLSFEDLSVSSAISAQDSILAVEPPCSEFSSSSDAIGKYSAVEGTYQIKQRFDKAKQNISNASISMSRKEIKKDHLRWLVV
jgi:hypothetical protein